MKVPAMFLPRVVLELVANRSFCFLRSWRPSYRSCGPMCLLRLERGSCFHSWLALHKAWLVLTLSPHGAFQVFGVNL